MRAAAYALDLDFIPVANEQYDLLCLRAFFDSARGMQLMEIVRSDALKAAVAALGGYDTSRPAKFFTNNNSLLALPRSLGNLFRDGPSLHRQSWFVPACPFLYPRSFSRVGLPFLKQRVR